MTTVVRDAPRPSVQAVTFDLYRDIHKGIRSELFAVTLAAGTIDPSSELSRAEVAESLRSVAWLLRTHAEHEEASIQPTLEEHLPDLAERVVADHERLERRVEDLEDLAERAGGLDEAPRISVHRLYVELASFTSAYLEHQDVEERLIMPALEQAIGADAVVSVHRGMIAAIPPKDLSRGWALMFPAMNVDDRTDMLGAIRAEAPPEVFDGVWQLAASVLAPADLEAVAARLGIP